MKRDLLHQNTTGELEQLMNCPYCGANLHQPRAITREYIAKNQTENEDSYCAGHYDKFGTFEPDGNPSYPLVNHDLLDGSDSCTSCGTIVG